MSKLISERMIETFERDGAVRVPGILNAKWLVGLNSIFDRLKARGRDLSAYYDADDAAAAAPAVGKTIVHDNCWRMDNIFYRFLRESPLAGAAASLLGSSEVRLYEDLLIYKSPGAEQPTPWHQDEPQWPLSGRQMISSWFCLDEVNAQEGALRFASGSHRGPLYRPSMPSDRQQDLLADEKFFDGGAIPNVDAHPARFPVKTFAVKPGDVIFFHPRSLHAAFGSSARCARRTFSIRFIGEDVRWLPKRTVFHEWLKQIDLPAGAEIAHSRFPRLWPALSAA